MTIDGSRPISLLPENPRYFLFRGEPTVLIASGEHYGAILNGRFDYRKYLVALAKQGLNHTRVFSGIYREVPGAFGITSNNLAPHYSDFAAPWARSRVPGAADGGRKFDLNQWNEYYFDRLKAFFTLASQLGIVVEFTLFCPFYAAANGDLLWDVCPMNSKNNVNGIGDVPPSEFYTMAHPDIICYQEALVTRLVHELNDFDNLFIEIANEPWNDRIALDWQYHIAELITKEESELPNRHLISRNVCNGYQRIQNPHSDISIYQFHYASPPEAVRINRDLALPIGLNETGFAGKDDSTYRHQAWEFMLAGGALYNNLDYSFAVGHEDGTYQHDKSTPGGGSTALRRQLRYLMEFLKSIEVWRLVPDRSFIAGVECAHSYVEAVSDQGGFYAIYVRGSFELVLDLELPAGDWRLEWLSPERCETIRVDTLTHPGGVAALAMDPHGEDVALKVTRI